MPIRPTAKAAERSYEHRHHAGNVGDVWKHLVAHLWLRTALAAEGAVTVLDTHAGAGRYRLAAPGEWTEGIGLLRELDGSAPAALCEWVRGVLPDRNEDRIDYPGSPLQALALLRPQDRLVAVERDAAAFAALRESLSHDARAEARKDDGLGIARELARESSERRLLVLIDPPFAAAEEWSALASALVDLASARSAPRLLAWYPFKGASRPALLLRRLEDAGVACLALELITTPLEEQRNRLNGSGLVAIHPPEGLAESAAECGAWLGARLAHQRGKWSLRVRAA